MLAEDELVGKGVRFYFVDSGVKLVDAFVSNASKRTESSTSDAIETIASTVKAAF